jgi:hypothetical protein
MKALVHRLYGDKAPCSATFPDGFMHQHRPKTILQSRQRESLFLPLHPVAKVFQ